MIGQRRFESLRQIDSDSHRFTTGQKLVDQFLLAGMPICGFAAAVTAAVTS
jgi:hypothetical protein